MGELSRPALAISPNYWAVFERKKTGMELVTDPLKFKGTKQPAEACILSISEFNELDRRSSGKNAKEHLKKKSSKQIISNPPESIKEVEEQESFQSDSIKTETDLSIKDKTNTDNEMLLQ